VFGVESRGRHGSSIQAFPVSVVVGLSGGDMDDDIDEVALLVGKAVDEIHGADVVCPPGFLVVPFCSAAVTDCSWELSCLFFLSPIPKPTLRLTTNPITS
jgi:hypothetical protein